MQTKLYDLLTALTPYSVIKAYQNGIEPTEPFITYALKFEQTPEHVLFSPVDSQGRQRIYTHVDVTLELQGFGERSSEILRDIAMKAQTQTGREQWERLGVALVNVGRITELPFLDEAKRYRMRSILECFLRYRVETQDVVSFIETVKVNHQLNALRGEQTIGVHHGED